MWGTAKCITLNAPFILVTVSLSHVASSSAQMLPEPSPAALFTTMSMWPNSSMAVCTRRSASSHFDTSA